MARMARPDMARELARMVRQPKNQSRKAMVARARKSTAGPEEDLEEEDVTPQFLQVKD